MSPEETFEEIVDDLQPRGVLPGAMFGSRSLTFEGKAFASLKGKRFAVKLMAETPAYAEALELDGAEVFDPSGKGRPFKDWIAVPSSQADSWHRLAEAALAALRTTGG